MKNPIDVAHAHACCRLRRVDYGIIKQIKLASAKNALYVYKDGHGNGITDRPTPGSGWVRAAREDQWSPLTTTAYMGCMDDELPLQEGIKDVI